MPDAPDEGSALDDFFSTDDIFRRVLATAAHELERPTSTFTWGALAAELILGFPFLARAVVTAAVPNQPSLVGDLLYPIGFFLTLFLRCSVASKSTA